MNKSKRFKITSIISLVTLLACTGCFKTQFNPNTLGMASAAAPTISTDTSTDISDPNAGGAVSSATVSSTASSVAAGITSANSDKFAQLEAYVQAIAPKFIGTGTNLITNTPQFPSEVLAIVTPDGAKVIGLGTVENGRAPTGTDVYPISSMSKMLTGLVLAQGVLKNQLTLTTPLKSLFKSSIKDGLTTETLEDAVTHYGSFADVPKNLNAHSTYTYDPGQGYDLASLSSCLLQADCSRTGAAIGSTYLYSSLGIGVLGIGLQEFYGLTFEQLLQSRISQPLGLTSTHASESNFNSGAYFVEGYTKDSVKVTPATMGILAPAGSVLTDGNDMLKLLQVMLQPTGDWTAIVNEATTPLKGHVGYAIDILSRNGMDFLSKSGDQAGYSSLMLWNKKSGVGIAALTNRGKNSATIAKMLIALHTKAVAIYGNSGSDGSSANSSASVASQSSVPSNSTPPGSIPPSSAPPITPTPGSVAQSTPAAPPAYIPPQRRPAATPPAAPVNICAANSAKYSSPVFRLVNGRLGDHFYTIDAAERDQGAIPNGYTSEGIAFYAFTSQVEGTVPVFRAWNPKIGDHFYTTSWDEMANSAAPNGWGYEEIAFYAFPSPVRGAVPAFRAWNPRATDHFYTISLDELKDSAIPAGWHYEGVAFFAFPFQGASECN